MSLPAVFKDMNCYLDGAGYQGKIEEITLPVIKTKTEEYSAGGMAAPVDIDMGLEKLEATVTFCGFMPEVASKMSTTGIQGLALRFRGAFQNDETLEWTPMEIAIRCRMTAIEMSAWKRAEKSTFKITLAVPYYKLTFGAEVKMEIDVLGNKYIIDGHDLYAGKRAALGM